MPGKAPDSEGFTPYRPPWYPHQDDPWTIVGNMSNNIQTNYSKWCATLEPGELQRLIREHRKKVNRDGS